MDLPKISCLTVTKDRIEGMRRAIHDFAQQRYPNKELVIITDGTDAFCENLKSIINTYSSQVIRLVQLPEKNWTVGALRNQAVLAASGEIICQWDDDDWYHPDRLSRQYEAMRNQHAKACTFTDQLAYFVEEQELYWVDWKNNEEHPTGIPGTIMAYKSIMPNYAEQGELARKHEDSDLLTRLAEKNSVALLSGQGHLYVYCCHGNNSFSYLHHLVIVVCYAIPINLFDGLKQRLQAVIDGYVFPKNLQINWSEAGALFNDHAGL